MNNKIKGKRSILQIVAVFLTAIFVVNLFALLLSIKERLSYDIGYDYSEMQRAYEEKDYPLISSMVYYNEVYGKNEKEKTTEFIDIVKQYENDLIQDAYKKARGSK